MIDLKFLKIDFMKVKSIMIGLLLCCVVGNVNAQKKYDKCLERVLDIYKQLNNPAQATNDTLAYLMEYRVRTRTSGADSEEKSSAGSVIVQGDYTEVKTDYLDLYRDEKFTFTIIAARKTVMIGDSDGGIDKEKRKNTFLALNDTLMKSLTVIECNTKEVDGRMIQKIVMSGNDWLEKYQGISEIVFEVDDAGETFHRITLHHSAEAPMTFSEYTFNKIDYNYRFERPESIYDRFMDEEGKLNAIYSTYKLIDVRSANRERPSK